MQENTEKIVFLSNLPAQELALAAKQSPTDSTIDSVLTTRIKNLSYCLKENWFSSLPLEDRQQIIYCISNGLEHPTPDFYQQLKKATLPAYQAETSSMQEMFFGVLEKFAILAPVNINEERRHFFAFYFKQLEFFLFLRHNIDNNRATDRRLALKMY